MVPEEENEDIDSDSDSSGSEFHEIITSSGSEEDTYASSDEDDALLLELAIGGAYACDPPLFKKKSENEPCTRSSLLFLDKDLLDDDSLCAGTIKNNRKGFPKELLPDDISKVPIGSFHFATTPELTVVVMFLLLALSTVFLWVQS